jgi:hypothetical protein
MNQEGMNQGAARPGPAGGAPAGSPAQANTQAPAGGQAAEQTGRSQIVTLAQALSDLQTAVADASTSADQLTALVDGVRAARERAKADVAAADKELRLLLTPDQEAILVSQGYMD